MNPDAICKYCLKPVSKVGVVHTACRKRQEWLEGIDDGPTTDPIERRRDYHGNEIL